MIDFFLFLLHNCVEVVKCMSEGGEIEEMRNQFVASSKKFEDFVAISVVFDMVPEFAGSESDGLLRHCQSL